MNVPIITAKAWFASGVLAAVVLALSAVAPQAAHAGNLHRLAANFTSFDGSEIGTFSTVASPLLIYDETVSVPGGDNVIYVAIHGTSDVHGNSQLLLRCEIDGVACNPGTGPRNDAPAGWVVLQKLTTDSHDNNVNYQWCAPVRSGFLAPVSHTVHLKMACGNSDGDSSCPNEVFMEQVNFTVDSSSQSFNACTGFPTPGGSG